jgi:RNA polymerase sigma factor (sigma-70 family)
MHIDLEKVYFQYKDSLLKFVYTLTRNQDDTEDIVHDTFSKLAVLNRNDKIDNRSLKSFIFKIAYNVFVDIYRKEKKSTSIDNKFFEEIIGKEDKENKIIDPIKFKQAILNSIYSLEINDRVKDVLKLRILLHLEFEEISVIFEISKRTVYRDFEVGMNELRRKLLLSGFDIEDFYETE